MTPNMLPPTVIAKMIHSGFMPVDSPRIFGPRISPSNCCRQSTMMAKTRALTGCTNSRIRMPGTAPINGPKYGIMFVTPTITLINRVYGSCRIVIRMKHSTPMIAESINFPVTKLLNSRLHSERISWQAGMCFCGRNA